MNIPIVNRRFILQLSCVSVLFALIIAVGYAYYGSGKKELVCREHEKLQALADLKTSQLHEWLHEREGDAALFLSSTAVQRAFAGYLESGSLRDKKESLQCLAALLKTYRYRTAFLLDREGRIALSTGRQETLSSGDYSAVRQSMEAQEITLSDIEKDGQGKFHMDICAPFSRDASKHPLGALVLRIDAEAYLYPSLKIWPGPSTSAETLLVRRDGNDVLFLNDLRYRKNTALTYRIPMDRADLPAAMIVRGVEHTVEGHDYRGVKVLFAGKAVAGTPWFLVAKLDAAEVYAPLQNRAIFAALLSVLLFVAFASLLWVIWRQREAEFLRTELREQAQAAAEIAESEENLAVTLASIGDAVIATDKEGRVTRMNAVAEELTGWPLADAMGRPLNEVFVIVNEETRLPLENPVHKVLETGGIVGLANHAALIARDGSELPIADSGAPIKDKNGNILGVVLVFRDQAEERRREREVIKAQDSLRESETLLRQVFEAIPDMVLVLDRERRINHSNWHGMLQDVPQADRMRKPYCHEILHKAQGTFCDSCPTLQVLDSGTPCQTELNMPGHGLFEVRTYPILDDSGSVAMVVKNYRDITAHRKTEEQLRHSQKMEAIGTLAGGIAHDFNNILTVIVGYGNILMMRLEEGDPKRDDLAKILIAADRATALTKGLLAYSRKGAINLLPVDFNDILSKVDRLLSRIIGEDIELTINPCKNKLTILGDEGQIEQILMNLASNARDAMQGNGRLKIEVDETILDTSFQELHGYGEKGHYALLTVSDNGSGMDEATKERVFEPFFTTKELGKGTGLGLAMVYSIVKQHKGFINVYSEPGKGTTFRIYLPLTGFAPKDNGDGVQLPQRGFGETILIVEDSEEIRNVFGDMLKDFGYRVISADNGEEGVEKFMLHRDEIDLLLLDVIMPRKNGMQTLNDIRFLKPDVKALFMSGYTADVINDKGIDTERIDMLSKPFSPLSLFAKVREVLDRPMEESI